MNAEMKERAAHAVSLHTLRRFEAGELQPPQRADVETHAASCADCADALSQMKAERAALRVAVPFETLAARVEAREQTGARLAAPAWLRWAWGPLVAVAGAAVFGVMTFPDRGGGAPGERPGVRLKGGSITVHGKAPGADKSLPLMVGEKVGPGWALRVEFNAGAAKFVTLAGVDADGKLFVYHEGFAQPGRQVAPGSIVLDQDPRPERLYAIFGDAAVPRAALLQAARQAAASGIAQAERLPGVGGEQSSWLLVKQ